MFLLFFQYNSKLYETIEKGLSIKMMPFYVPISIARTLAAAGDIGGSVAGRALPFNTNVLKKLTGTLVFSCVKIQKELGFKPKYNLFNTIDDTVGWYRENRLVSGS